MAAHRKPANTWSVNGDTWISTLKRRWPKHCSFLPALLSLWFCLPVSPRLPVQEFLLSASLIDWWQLAEGTVGQWCSYWKTWKYFPGIHIKTQMLLLFDTENWLLLFPDPIQCQPGYCNLWWYEAILLMPSARQPLHAAWQIQNGVITLSFFFLFKQARGLILFLFFLELVLETPVFQNKLFCLWKAVKHPGKVAPVH